MSTINPVTHISEDPHNFDEVFSRQLSLADDVRKGQVEIEQGAVEAKALYGATKSLEGDLHARIFADRVARRPLPYEHSGDEEGRIA